MADYTALRIDEMEGAFGGAFRRARACLGVTSFGMAILDMPAHATRYPEHDHSGDGQEEVYVVLRGGGEIDIEGERIGLDPEVVVRVGAGTKRKLLPGAEGMRVLVVGGTPGRTYEAPGFSELGAPSTIG